MDLSQAPSIVERQECPFPIASQSLSCGDPESPIRTYRKIPDYIGHETTFNRKIAQMQRAIDPAKPVMTVPEPNGVGAVDCKGEYLGKLQLIFPRPVFPPAVMPPAEPSTGAEPQAAVRSLGKRVDPAVQQSLPDSPGFKTPILEDVRTGRRRIDSRRPLRQSQKPQIAFTVLADSMYSNPARIGSDVHVVAFVSVPAEGAAQRATA